MLAMLPYSERWVKDGLQRIEQMVRVAVHLGATEPFPLRSLRDGAW